jgi:hypothetical protein
MLWSRRSPDSATASRPVIEDPIEHDSPALAELFASLDAESGSRILDLGPALASNFEHYSAIASVVRIVDLIRTEPLHRLVRLEADEFVHLLTRLLPIGASVYDLILTWDLVNYLDHNQPDLVARHLAAVANRNAKLHAMVVTSDSMPALPSRYELREPGRLVYRPTTSRTAPAPNPTPAQVESWLHPFRIQRSIVLRHGVREFIAVYP